MTWALSRRKSWASALMSSAPPSPTGLGTTGAGGLTLGEGLLAGEIGGWPLGEGANCPIRDPIRHPEDLPC
jgi:hypothetical protein